jgi:hypothetical protein
VESVEHWRKVVPTRSRLQAMALPLRPFPAHVKRRTDRRGRSLDKARDLPFHLFAAASTTPLELGADLRRLGAERGVTVALILGIGLRTPHPERMSSLRNSTSGPPHRRLPFRLNGPTISSTFVAAGDRVRLPGAMALRSRFGHLPGWLRRF